MSYARHIPVMKLNFLKGLKKAKSPAEKFIETYSYKSHFFEACDKGNQKAESILSTTSMDPLYWISVETGKDLVDKKIKEGMGGIQTSLQQIIEHISGDKKLT